MAKLVFYRQKRYDGAVRTGVELDDRTVVERFQDVPGDRDPALLWYVDLKCEGPVIPDNPDEATHWLVDHTETIREGLAKFADHLRAGADPDIYSLTWDDFPDVPEDVQIKVSCSAIRRVDARQMANNLNEIAENWRETLDDLDVPQGSEDLR